MVTLSGVDSSGLEGKTSIVKPFRSSTCSLLSKYIPNLRSKMFFRCLINLVVISMLGPVTIHIWLVQYPWSFVDSQAINLNMNSVTREGPMAHANWDNLHIWRVQPTDIMNTYYKILYKTLLPISLVPMISLLFFITASNNFVYALVMRGTQGNDNLSGTPKDDSMEGLRGNDNMARIEGNDAIEGSQGNDILKGSEGNDYLNGGKITICSMLKLEMMN